MHHNISIRNFIKLNNPALPCADREEQLSNEIAAVPCFTITIIRKEENNFCLDVTMKFLGAMATEIY